VVQVNPRGAVDVERPLLRVAQWVAGQELGFDDETVEGAGHLPQLEQFEAVSGLVTSFLG